MVNNRLPRHPLVAKGYPSIGCAPCTSPVKPGEDPRAGRWRGQQKTECGIHFIDGKAVRGPSEGERGMSVLVTDTGFAARHLARKHRRPWPIAHAIRARVDLANTDDPAALADHLDDLTLIRVAFPAFSDGRGFTIARRLRHDGLYRAACARMGQVIADQYAMVRRVGFDEVEIPDEIWPPASPQTQWQFRADWQAHDYQSRLRA